MAITLYDVYNRPVQRNILSQEIARPSMTGIRSIWNHSYVTGGLTPQSLATLLKDAAEGNADAQLTLAEEIEEKDLHYASVLGTRKRAVARIPIVIEAASDDPKDVKMADEIRALLKRRGTKGMIEDSLDALGKGYSVVEIIWDKSKKPWQPVKYAWRDPRFFQYDRETLTELRLKDEVDMMNGLPLPAYKFIVHTPRLKAGIPIRGGLARLAAWTYIFKNFAVKDWVAFCEVFGMPLRLGKYRPGETEDNINILKSAVANLGSDAAAVIPDGMMIEFIENSKAGTGGEGVFERIANWFDKQLSKAILGQTMTADDGSSNAQAQVHDEVREDIRDADSEQLAETLERDLVIPYIDLNYGPQANYPSVCLREADQTDITIMSEALAKLVPLGLKVEVSEVRDKLGFSDPAKDAECLGTSAAPVVAPVPEAKNPAVAANRETTCPHCVALNAEGQPLLDQVDQIVLNALGLDNGSNMIAGIREQIIKAGSLENAAAMLSPQGMNTLPIAAAIGDAQILASLIGRDEITTDLALNAEQAQPISLPFEEAINFFRQKLGLQSATWSEIYANEHDHAFTVAGVMRDDMLSDFRLAIDQAIADGTTYQVFLGNFDTIVAKYGWSYNGSRGWRSRVIYDTNIRTSYQAGRYAQMTDPDVLKYRPNWMYQHGDSVHPRPLHLSWHGIVLPADDPWWQSHFTPNGWGCKCRVVPLSGRDLTRLGKTVGTAPNDGTFEWVNPATGEVRDIPRGIDPGWDYNPGRQWLNPQTGKLEGK